MTGNLTKLDALRPPASAGVKLRTVPGPQGITSSVLEGDAGIFPHNGRRYVYTRIGNATTWWQWFFHEPLLLFPEPLHEIPA